MFGELADINFGDIHVENPKEAGTGISAVIVRDTKWFNLLMEAQQDGVLQLTEITVEKMLNRRTMAFAKKKLNTSFVKLLKKLNLIYPKYDSDYQAQINIKVILRYITKRTRQYVGAHRSLWFMLPKIK